MSGDCHPPVSGSGTISGSGNTGIAGKPTLTAVRFLRWFCERRKGDMNNTWQPIKTAPKDGTDILVAWWSAGVWFVRNAWWEDGFNINTRSVDAASEGWWYPNTSVGTYKVCRENNAVDGPQYWMPMPEPPAEHGSK